MQILTYSRNGCFGAFSWFSGAAVAAKLSLTCTTCPQMDACIKKTRDKTRKLFPYLCAQFDSDINAQGYETACERMSGLTRGELDDPYLHTAQQNWSDGNAHRVPGTYYSEMEKPRG